MQWTHEDTRLALANSDRGALWHRIYTVNWMLHPQYPYRREQQQFRYRDHLYYILDRVVSLANSNPNPSLRDNRQHAYTTPGDSV